MMFLMAQGLFAHGPRFFVSLGMELLALLWIWRNLRYGTVELSRQGLVVRGYGRAVRLELADLVTFDSSLSVRGAGHRREVLLVTRSGGEQAKFDCIHDRSDSIRMRHLIDELNYSLKRLRDEVAHHADGHLPG